MIKIATCGAASMLVLAACSSPEPQTAPMVELQPAISAPAPAVQEAPVSQTIDIAISGMMWVSSWGGKVSKALAALPWVEEYDVQVGSAKIKVNADYDEFATLAAIEAAGFGASIK